MGQRPALTRVNCFPGAVASCPAGECEIEVIGLPM